MSYKTAICTSSGSKVDLHFGQTRRFLIAKVDSMGAWSPITWVDAPERRAGQEHCMEWFDAVAMLLLEHGVEYVWCAKIGPKPHRALSAAGISPLETPEDIDETAAAVNRYRNRSMRAT